MTTERDQTDDALPKRIIANLRICGRYLYFKMGGRTGRRRIFYVLLKQGELPQRELQEILGVCSGSLSEILAKIEADGLIEKTVSRTDGRKLNIRLTGAGLDQALKMQAEYEEMVLRMFDCFSTEQQKAFLSMLETLVKHWDSLTPP